MARGFYDTYKEYDYTDNNIENFGSNIEYKNDGEYKIVWYDNIDNLLHKLPSVFNSYDIIQMAHVTVCGIKNYEYYDCCITHLISRCLLEQYRITLTNIEKRMIDLIEINKLLYDNVVKGEYRCRFLGAAVAPLYMREDEDDSIQSDGDNVDQEYINDIKGANVYIPIINDNDTLIDIDEQLAEDDPEYSQIDEELK
jgi:DNA polymerase III delta prime subunit